MKRISMLRPTPEHLANIRTGSLHSVATVGDKFSPPPPVLTVRHPWRCTWRFAHRSFLCARAPYFNSLSSKTRHGWRGSSWAYRIEERLKEKKNQTLAGMIGWPSLLPDPEFGWVNSRRAMWLRCACGKHCSHGKHNLYALLSISHILEKHTHIHRYRCTWVQLFVWIFVNMKCTVPSNEVENTATINSNFAHWDGVRVLLFFRIAVATTALDREVLKNCTTIGTDQPVPVELPCGFV